MKDTCIYDDKTNKLKFCSMEFLPGKYGETLFSVAKHVPDFKKKSLLFSNPAFNTTMMYKIETVLKPTIPRQDFEGILRHLKLMLTENGHVIEIVSIDKNARAKKPDAAGADDTSDPDTQNTKNAIDALILANAKVISDTEIPTIATKHPDAFFTFICPVKEGVPPEQLQSFLGAYATEMGMTQPSPGGKFILVTDYGSALENIRQVLHQLEEFPDGDVDGDEESNADGDTVAEKEPEATDTEEIEAASEAAAEDEPECPKYSKVFIQPHMKRLCDCVQNNDNIIYGMLLKIPEKDVITEDQGLWASFLHFLGMKTAKEMKGKKSFDLSVYSRIGYPCFWQDSAHELIRNTDWTSSLKDFVNLANRHRSKVDLVLKLPESSPKNDMAGDILALLKFVIADAKVPVAGVTILIEDYQKQKQQDVLNFLRRLSKYLKTVHGKFAVDDSPYFINLYLTSCSYDKFQDSLTMIDRDFPLLRDDEEGDRTTLRLLMEVPSGELNKRIIELRSLNENKNIHLDAEQLDKFMRRIIPVINISKSSITFLENDLHDFDPTLDGLGLSPLYLGESGHDPGWIKLINETLKRQEAPGFPCTIVCPYGDYLIVFVSILAALLMISIILSLFFWPYSTWLKKHVLINHLLGIMVLLGVFIRLGCDPDVDIVSSDLISVALFLCIPTAIAVSIYLAWYLQFRKN